MTRPKPVYDTLTDVLNAKKSGELDQGYPGAILFLDNDYCEMSSKVVNTPDEYITLYRGDEDLREAVEILTFLGIDYQEA